MHKHISLLTAIILLIGAGCTTSNTTAPAPSASTPPKQTAPPDKQTDTDPYANQETRDLRLNFKDTFVRFTGYPYVDKAYRPRLYNLIYIDTVFAFNDMVNLTDPSGKWKDAYEMSTKENRIYIPVGRSPGNVPIWQTMDIVQREQIPSILGSCTETSIPLADPLLVATSYQCQPTDKNKESIGSAPCFIPIEGNKGILYRQFSTDGSATGSMCDVLKNNFIRKVVFEAFK